VTNCQVLGVLPNMVISTCFQAAWEKFFRYFDVEARFCKPLLKDHFKVNAESLAAMCDEKTIGVVGILGNHYNGAYDPIWEIDEAIGKLNSKKGYQIGIHVDAASGGFIAPFQDGMPPFDFRLENVLSISASGHKFGESVCGTGWVVFRHRENLAEHIAVSVSYLGGHCDSMTLNFSRPATAAYVQYYKFLRLGLEGYKQKVDSQMLVSKFLRDRLKAMTFTDGRPRFHVLDDGETYCLPVVAACLNLDGGIPYTDIDLQHALAESHWYVSGYNLSFDDFTNNGKLESLLQDVHLDDSMFRVVVKSNLTMSLAEDLADHIDKVIPMMDSMKDGYHSLHSETKKQKSAAYWATAKQGVLKAIASRSSSSQSHAAC
jgi:glutamate decarboxylase